MPPNNPNTAFVFKIAESASCAVKMPRIFIILPESREYTYMKGWYQAKTVSQTTTNPEKLGMPL